MKKIGRIIKKYIYIYRFDIIGNLFMIMTTLVMFDFFFKKGIIVFSDIDFPYNSKDYMNQIIGVFNHRFNTSAMLNTPRFFSILPSFIMSAIFDFSGAVFIKVFVIQNLLLSCMGFYVFVKRLLRIYYNPYFNLPRIMAIAAGSVYYGLNPWVMMRIQHIYLLVGYSLFPFLLLQFFKIFDHKFQAVVNDSFNPYSGKVYRHNVVDCIVLGFGISVAAGAIHYFFYTAMLFAALLGLILFKYTIKYIRKGIKTIMLIYWGMIKRGMILAITVIGFSAYWFFVYIGSILLNMQASQHNVNVLDTYTAFSQNSDIIKVLYLISYWWPMKSLSFLSWDFYMAGGAILVIAAIGVTLSVKKNNIVLFFGLLGGVLAILATGVYYLPIAPYFLLFVKIPVIGSLFRDPNKLAGIMSLCIGVAFVFGTDILIEYMSRLKLRLWVYMTAFIVCAASVVFVYGIKDEYVAYFYNPVEEPESYKEVKMQLQDDQYTIYMPLAEEMLQQSRIATPYWNGTDDEVQKATGDVHIYNTVVNTLFHHEGNDPNIGYFYRYMQFLLDEKRTNKISDFIRALGSKRLVYHDEYQEQEERQDANKNIIEKDKQLTQTYENDIFTIYEREGEIQNKPKGIIYTTKGFEALNMYQEIDGYDMLQYPTIFGYEYPKASQIFDEEVETIIDSSDETELLMSFIDESYHFYPFDIIQEGNPFLKWAKTYVSSVDWTWYMQSKGYRDRQYSFDMDGGLAVAFSSAMLNVLPYEKKTMQGNKIMDFDTLLSEELFFEADNKELFEIRANPYNEGNIIQTVHGELVKGEPKEIWQVAKSGLIEAKPSMAYTYDLLISGRNLDSFHLKARFYDDAMEEVGIAYIVAPDEEADYDTMEFVGEVISPSDASYMRIDLLSFQNISTKSFWWVHDINIYELPEYVEENTIRGYKEVETETEYTLYTRVFASPQGGELRIQIDDEVYDIDTFDEISHFKWFNLGKKVFHETSVPISLTNIDGFQAVNSISVIPSIDIENSRAAMEKAIEDSTMMASVESVIQLRGNKQLQSMRTDETLSYGNGLDLLKERVYTPLTIYKSGNYVMEVSAIYPNEEGTVSYNIGQYEGVMDSEASATVSMYLKQGEYVLSFDIDSKAMNYVPVSRLKPFFKEEDFVKNIVEDSVMVDCSQCETITEDMTSYELGDNEIRMNYDATCSCDWYIYSSDKIDVQPTDEWYVQFDAVSEFIQKRHGKVIFLDENDDYLSYTFINEVEEKDKDKWNYYEQIFEVPEGAKSMYVQFWTRGNKSNDGYLEIKDLIVSRYKDFITLDHSLIYERSLDLTQKNNQAPVKMLDRSEGAFRFDYSEGLLNTFISPNIQFVLDAGNQQHKLNGVTAGYVLYPENNQEGEVVWYAPLFNIYKMGAWVTLVMFIISLLYIVAWPIIIRKRGRKSEK